MKSVARVLLTLMRVTFTQQKILRATDLVPWLRQERHICRNKTKQFLSPSGAAYFQIIVDHNRKMPLLTELENLCFGWILQKCHPYGAGLTKTERSSYRIRIGSQSDSSMKLGLAIHPTGAADVNLLKPFGN